TGPHRRARECSFLYATVTSVPPPPLRVRGRVAALSANPTPPTPSARRAAIAGFLGLIVPGLGHALVGRRRGMLLFIVPMVLLAAAVLGYYAGGGWPALAAFAVTPGVLPALAIVNIALAVWRIAAALDAARATTRPGPVIALLGPAILLLVVAPHLWAGSTIAAAIDFLDSMFASGDEPTETEAPTTETIPPDFTFPPDGQDWNGPTDEPL